MYGQQCAPRQSKSETALSILSDPSTLPHIALLVILSGSLYGAMSLDVFGLGSRRRNISVPVSIIHGCGTNQAKQAGRVPTYR